MVGTEQTRERACIFYTNNGNTISWIRANTNTFDGYGKPGCVAYAGGRWVIGKHQPGGNTYTFAYSSNRQSWTTTFAEDLGIAGIAGDGNGLWVAVTSVGKIIISEDNAETWTTLDTVFAGVEFTDVDYGPDGFYAVASSGDVRIWKSEDGFNWSPVAAPAGSWLSINYSNNRYMVTGIDGVVYNVSEYLEESKEINKEYWCPTQREDGRLYVAWNVYGNSGNTNNTGNDRILYSDDHGRTWTQDDTWNITNISTGVKIRNTGWGSGAYADYGLRYYNYNQGIRWRWILHVYHRRWCDLDRP